MKFIAGQCYRAARGTAVMACIVWALLATSIDIYAGDAFSFLVVGDTRAEPYLPGGPCQAEDMKTVLQKRYHDKPVRLCFDPIALKLERVEIQEDKDSTLVLYYEDGWPRTIVKTGDCGVSRVIMRDVGRKWIFNRIVSAIKKGAQNQPEGALFLVHGGDISVFGYQGKSLDESPYWQLFEEELLSRLPPPDKGLGLPARVLAAVGNHETWKDKEISGMLTTMPWLKELGLSPGHRIYAVTFRNCHFIFLDSGDYSTPEDWTSQFPPFEEQMDFLVKELKKAKNAGIDHVFVVYHKPSFVKVGHDPLPEERNPHKFLKPFATDFNIIVFNSHTHSTEHYLVDGVDYLVIGAGGAPQVFSLTDNPSPQEELYWKEQDRVEEYNYLRVEVEGAKVRGMIHRFRPTKPKCPMGLVEVFGEKRGWKRTEQTSQDPVSKGCR